MINLQSVTEAIAIAGILSMDVFATGFAYGSKKIKIPFSSVMVINLICSGTLGLSLFLGGLAKDFLTPLLPKIICFLILISLGMSKLFDSFTRTFISKNTEFNREIKFSLFNFKFILNLYANPEQADVNLSKTISPGEAVSLALAMSLDGLAVGFGAAMVNVNGYLTVLSSLIMTMIAINLGCLTGKKIADRSPVNLSWIGGAVLIVLAFLKLV